MEDNKVREANGTVDLLSLIGSAIEQLQQSIQLFESADAQAGAQRLATVIRDIGAYLEHLDGDPIVQLSGISTSNLADSLHHVQSDLSSVVQHVEHPAMG
ncbi:hypothetical protein KJ567_03070 [Candidatus Bipolaricaulota bacterium]|nr:hypothetical protein [Candidatus Bipolaricaulota bacterium]